MQKQYSKISFTWNLENHANTAMFFNIEEVRESILGFSQGTIMVLWFCYIFANLFLI